MCPLCSWPANSPQQHLYVKAKKILRASAILLRARLSCILMIFMWPCGLTLKFALLNTSAFVFARLKNVVVIPKIFRSPFNWKASSLDTRLAGISTVFRAYRSLECNNIINQNFVFMLRWASFQKMPRLLDDAVADAILFEISEVMLTFLVNTRPRYVASSACFIFGPSLKAILL